MRSEAFIVDELIGNKVMRCLAALDFGTTSRQPAFLVHHFLPYNVLAQNPCLGGER